MKTLFLILIAAPLFGQASQSSIPPLGTVQTINFYISTGGSDSNPCTSAAKCLTLAHVLKLIPRVLDNSYIINVADGTYAEAINTAGFQGASSIFTSGSPQIKILGNTTTPANVIFSGTTSACMPFSINNGGACISGTAKVALYGLTITNGARDGISCFNGMMELNKVIVTMTGGASAVSVGVNAQTCPWNISDNVTISGFDTNTAPTGGLGFYSAWGTQGTFTSGTLTITGPGGATADGTVGMVVEYGPSGVAMSSTSALVITGTYQALLVNSNSSFEDFSGAPVTLTNSVTPSGTPTGIQTNGGGVVDIGGPLTISHFTYCIQANLISGISQGPSGTYARSLTNCTSTNTSGGGNVVLF